MITPLETGWRCAAFDHLPTPAELGIVSVGVSRLTAWRPDSQSPTTLWLARTFVLAPTEMCISYYLVFERAPVGTQVYVNGKLVGTAKTRWRVDVTDVVALDENQVMLCVDPSATGSFTGVSLQAVPCD